MTQQTVSLHRGPVEYVIPVFTVLHLTDPTVGYKPVALGVSDWFSQAEAEDHAREMSIMCPSPQRFSVYTPDWEWLSSWQCGEVLPAFVIV